MTEILQSTVVHMRQITSTLEPVACSTRHQLLKCFWQSQLDIGKFCLAMSHQPDNISTGTQVVALIEIRGPNQSLVHPRDAVGVVTRSSLPELPSEELGAKI